MGSVKRRIPLEKVGLDGVNHLAELTCKTSDEQATEQLLLIDGLWQHAVAPCMLK